MDSFADQKQMPSSLSFAFPVTRRGFVWRSSTRVGDDTLDALLALRERKIEGVSRLLAEVWCASFEDARKPDACKSSDDSIEPLEIDRLSATPLRLDIRQTVTVIGKKFATALDVALGEDRQTWTVCCDAALMDRCAGESEEPSPATDLHWSDARREIESLSKVCSKALESLPRLLDDELREILLPGQKLRQQKPPDAEISVSVVSADSPLIRDLFADIRMGRISGIQQLAESPFSKYDGSLREFLGFCGENPDESANWARMHRSSTETTSWCVQPIPGGELALYRYRESSGSAEYWGLLSREQPNFGPNMTALRSLRSISMNAASRVIRAA